MARCKDCIHGEVCDIFVHTRTLICNDKADKMCKMFKSIADVVPKSEWNRIYTELEDLKSGTLPRLRLDLQMANTKVAEADMAKTEVAREIFEEIEKYLVAGTTYYGHCIYTLGVGTFTELKKKYTEAKE